MGQADWGGGVDYSGLFGNLAESFLNDVQRGIDESVSRSEEEQAADDAEKYDQWKNGIISDGDWLEYLRRRVRQTKGDPKERQYWTQTLREHETAIGDARLETAFELGQISVHKLIAHYQGRMKGVKKGSPAYREAASRYSQLVDYRDQTTGGGSAGGSSGGSGGSGGSSRSYWPKGYKPADLGGSGGQAAPGKGKGGKGAEFPVDPINQLSGFHGFDDYMQGLFGDLDRIDTIMKQLDANPSLKTLTDPLTGETFAVTPDLVHEIDRQYLATQDMIAAAKWADGDKDGATQALKYRGEYVATRMHDHNTDRVKPVWDEQVSTFLAGMVTASAIEDPEARARAYQQLASPLKKTADRILYADVKTTTRRTGLEAGSVNEAPTPSKTTRTRKTTELPDELRVDDVLSADIEATLKLADAFADPSLSLDQRAALIGDVIDHRPYDYRLTAEQIQEYADGNREIGLIGGMETHVARQGLADGTHAFFYDGTAMRVMTPEEILATVPADDSGAPSIVSSWQRVNGRSQRVFVQVQPTESDFFAYKWSKAAGEDSAGTFVPSSQIDGMSKGQFNQALNSGLIEQVPVQPGWRSTVMPDGSVWFEDPETNLWYKDKLPIVNMTDRTGGVMVGEDGTLNFKYNRFASAGGVLMPFSGVSPQEAQRLVEGDVNTGVVNLADYATRDETGEAQYDQPNLQGMYWDPRDARGWAEVGGDDYRAFNIAAGREMRDVFAQRAEDRIKGEAQQWARTLRPDEHGLWREAGIDPVDYATDRIDQFGESIGLKMLNDEQRGRQNRPELGTSEAAIEHRLAIQRAKMPTVKPIRAKLPVKPATRQPLRTVEPERAPLPKPKVVREQQTSSNQSPRPRQPKESIDDARRRVGRGFTEY